MKSLWGSLGSSLGILLAFSIVAQAQVYDDKYDMMVAPMDKAVDVHELYNDREPAPGDDEKAMPQDVWYEKMVTTMDQGAEHHFAVLQETTVIEHE